MSMRESACTRMHCANAAGNHPTVTGTDSAANVRQSHVDVQQ